LLQMLLLLLACHAWTPLLRLHLWTSPQRCSQCLAGHSLHTAACLCNHIIEGHVQNNQLICQMTADIKLGLVEIVHCSPAASHMICRTGNPITVSCLPSPQMRLFGVKPGFGITPKNPCCNTPNKSCARCRKVYMSEPVS